MGILNWFARSKPGVQQLPAGSFTVDREGHVLNTTVGSAYSERLVGEIAHEVLLLFREAREAQMPLTSLDLHFASLRISAREMQGGALIFLLPQSTFETAAPAERSQP
jgi:hypothetical protein